MSSQHGMKGFVMNGNFIDGSGIPHLVVQAKKSVEDIAALQLNAKETS